MGPAWGCAVSLAQDRMECCCWPGRVLTERVQSPIPCSLVSVAARQLLRVGAAAGGEGSCTLGQEGPYILDPWTRTCPSSSGQGVALIQQRSFCCPASLHLWCPQDSSGVSLSRFPGSLGSGIVVNFLQQDCSAVGREKPASGVAPPHPRNQGPGSLGGARPPALLRVRVGVAKARCPGCACPSALSPSPTSSRGLCVPSLERAALGEGMWPAWALAVSTGQSPDGQVFPPPLPTSSQGQGLSLPFSALSTGQARGSAGLAHACGQRAGCGGGWGQLTLKVPWGPGPH